MRGSATARSRRVSRQTCDARKDLEANYRLMISYCRKPLRCYNAGENAILSCFDVVAGNPSFEQLLVRRFGSFAQDLRYLSNFEPTRLKLSSLCPETATTVRTTSRGSLEGSTVMICFTSFKACSGEQRRGQDFRSEIGLCALDQTILFRTAVSMFPPAFDHSA